MSSEIQLICMQAQPVIERLSFLINLNDPIGIRRSLTMARYQQAIQHQKILLKHTGSWQSPQSHRDFRRNSPSRRVLCRIKLAIRALASPRFLHRETTLDGQCMLDRCHLVTLKMFR